MLCVFMANTCAIKGVNQRCFPEFLLCAPARGGLCGPGSPEEGAAASKCSLVSWAPADIVIPASFSSQSGGPCAVVLGGQAGRVWKLLDG